MKASELVRDPFPGFDIGIWNVYGDDTSKLSFTGGQLQITTKTTAAYEIAETIDTTDFIDSYILAQLVDAGNRAIGSSETVMGIIQDPGVGENWLRWLVSGDQLLAMYCVATIETTIIQITYNPVIHVWLRIREKNGIIYWEYTPDPETTAWTIFGQLAKPFELHNTTTQILGGNYDNEVSTLVFKWDNYNVVKDNGPGNYGKYVKVGSGMSRSERAS